MSAASTPHVTATGCRWLRGTQRMLVAVAASLTLSVWPEADDRARHAVAAGTTDVDDLDAVFDEPA